MDYHHIPVLLKESLEALAIDPAGAYLDLTFGGGGHSRAILGHLGKTGQLYAFDQDQTVQGHLLEDERFVFFPQNFRYAKRFLKAEKKLPVQGLLADLGISSHQIDAKERGFSIRYPKEILDMRMDKTAHLDAKIILNEYEEKQLAQIFWLFGELPQSQKIASNIVALRKREKIIHSFQLQNACFGLYPKKEENAFFARVFQALRIEVNQELDALKELLLSLPDLLSVGARAVFIAYHSLEDRLIKNFFKAGNLDGVIEKDFYGNPLHISFEQIHKKVILPSPAEILQNPRARSAKMRVGVKK